MSFWQSIVHGVHGMHERHRQAHFAVAVIALSAKMARTDGALFQNEPTVLERLLDGLFHIAKSDRAVGATELDFLRRVAGIFGFDADAFERIRHGHLGRDRTDPYVALGVSHAESEETVHAAWRRPAREHHPDRLIAQGMPHEPFTCRMRSWPQSTPPTRESARSTC